MTSINTPLVSVCVPTYNRPKTLERTIKCLINQTYKNLEIIISDNCSTNKEVEKVIQKYKVDPRINYIRQPVNKGAIFNFNCVIEKAKGEYFMRLADDDWLDQNYIETCLDFLLHNPDYVSAYGRAKIYSIEEKFLRLDADIDMTQDIAQERVLYYYSKIQNNGSFYGLVKTKYVNELIIKNELAIDWLVVARIVFLGKYKMVEGTHCNISEGGASQSTDHLTASFNMPPFTRAFPFLKVGLNIFQDILWGSQVYKSLSIYNRGRLGIKCALVIYKRFNIKSELRTGLKKYINLKFQGKPRQANNSNNYVTDYEAKN
jgi:glycosyltransferase domain-containing protein